MIVLNESWRVVEFDHLQWGLQHKVGKVKARWDKHSFCVTRSALVRCIGEYCGEVRDDALRLALALPDRFRPGLIP